MKKTLFVALAAAVVFATVSCGTTQRAASGRSVGGVVPEFVREALTNVPENALVGIGTANLPSLNQSRTIAQTRARADISRQLNSVISEMITDYTASAETDPSAALAFQETITTALSRSTLVGATTVNEDATENGDYWVVMILTQDNAAREIANAAESAARLSPGANAAMWAEDRMNAALNNNAQAPLQVSNYD